MNAHTRAISKLIWLDAEEILISGGKDRKI